MGSWGFDLKNTVSSEEIVNDTNTRYKNQYNNTYCLFDFSNKTVNDTVAGPYSGGLFLSQLVDLSDFLEVAPLAFRESQTTSPVITATIDEASVYESSLMVFDIPDVDVLKKKFAIHVGAESFFNGDQFGGPENLPTGDSIINLVAVSNATSKGYGLYTSLEVVNDATPVIRINTSLVKINGQNSQEVLSESFFDIADAYNSNPEALPRKSISFEYDSGNLIAYVNGVEVDRVFNIDYSSSSFDLCAVGMQAVDDYWIPAITWLALTDGSSPSLDINNRTSHPSYAFTSDQFGSESLLADYSNFSSEPILKNLKQLSEDGGELVTSIDFSLVPNNGDFSDGLLNGSVDCEAFDLSFLVPLGFLPLNIVDGNLVVGSDNMGVFFTKDESYVFQPNGMASSFDLPMRDIILEIEIVSVNSGWYLQGGFVNAEPGITNGSLYGALDGDGTVTLGRLYDNAIIPIEEPQSIQEVQDFINGKIVFVYTNGKFLILINDQIIYSYDYDTFISKAIPLFVFSNMTISHIAVKTIATEINPYMTAFLNTVANSDLTMELDNKNQDFLNELTPDNLATFGLENVDFLDSGPLFRLGTIYESISNYFKFINKEYFENNINISKVIVSNADKFRVQNSEIDFSYELNLNLSNLSNSNGEISDGKYTLSTTGTAELFKQGTFYTENETFTVCFGGFNGTKDIGLIVDDGDDPSPHINIYVTNSDNDLYELSATQMSIGDVYFVRFKMNSNDRISVCDFPYQLVDGDLLSIRFFTTENDQAIIYYLNGIPINSHLLSSQVFIFDKFGFEISDTDNGGSTPTGDWIPQISWMSASSGGFFDYDELGYHRYAFMYKLVKDYYDYVNGLQIMKDTLIFGPNIEMKDDNIYGDNYNGFDCDYRIIQFIESWIDDTNFMNPDGMCVSGQYTDEEWASVITYMKNFHDRNMLIFPKSFFGIGTFFSKTDSSLESNDRAFWPADAYFKINTASIPIQITDGWEFNGTISLQTEITGFKFLVNNISSPLLGSVPNIVIKDSDTETVVYSGSLPKSGNYFKIDSIGVVDENKFYDFSITGLAGSSGNGILSCVISGDNLDAMSTYGTILVLRS